MKKNKVGVRGLDEEKAALHGESRLELVGWCAIV